MNKPKNLYVLINEQAVINCYLRYPLTWGNNSTHEQAHKANTRLVELINPRMSSNEYLKLKFLRAMAYSDLTREDFDAYCHGIGNDTQWDDMEQVSSFVNMCAASFYANNFAHCLLEDNRNEFYQMIGAENVLFTYEDK